MNIAPTAFAHTPGFWYSRTVDATGGVTHGTGTLYVADSPLPPQDGPITFDYHAASTGMCDGTGVGHAEFRTQGLVTGSYTWDYNWQDGETEAGAWEFDGLAFTGPGDPGFTEVPVNGPFTVRADPSMSGPGLVFLYRFTYGGGGLAAGKATWATGECESGAPGAAAQVTSVDHSLASGCSTVGDWYWADSDQGVKTWSTAGAVDVTDRPAYHTKVFDCSGADTLYVNPAVDILNEPFHTVYTGKLLAGTTLAGVACQDKCQPTAVAGYDSISHVAFQPSRANYGHAYTLHGQGRRVVDGDGIPSLTVPVDVDACFYSFESYARGEPLFCDAHAGDETGVLPANAPIVAVFGFTGADITYTLNVLG